MIILFLLRQIWGYVVFSVSGRFPERFLNLSAKNGLVLWNIKPVDDKIVASARLSDVQLIYRLAGKNNNEIEILSENGLPVFGRKYKNRMGLLVGLIIGSLFCTIMSGFIWNIDINCPPEMNEYEIRNELRELGLYEGVRYDYDNISKAERNMLIRDGRISWFSINVTGTNAVVEISPKTEIDSKKSVEKNKTVSNMVASNDGIIKKISARKGNAVVRVGEAVRKGQLLVSGINTLSDGQHELCDSDADVIAEITHSVSFSISKNTVSNQIAEEIISKRSINIFRIELPYSLQETPLEEFYVTSEKQKLYLLGSPLPIYKTEEKYYKKYSSDIAADANNAGRILENRAKLYRIFLEGQKNTKIISETKSFSETKNEYRLSVTYNTTENIAQKSIIEVRSE